MPATQLILDVGTRYIEADLALPLNELQLAVGSAWDVTTRSETLVARDSSRLAVYIKTHFRAVSPDSTPWIIMIQNMEVGKGAQEATGAFQQLNVSLSMRPASGQSPRSLLLYYDAIIHQVASHRAYVSVRQDWETGQTEAQTEIGVLGIDLATSSVPPFVIHLDEGSNWRGFRSMLRLGAAHISSGTDHILFVLVLLLPAPLIARHGRWAAHGGTAYTMGRLLRVVTSFTIGHSLTLLAGTPGWIRLPAQPVEIVIAISILVASAHAFRPLFPGRETYIAAGFGLVHGLAFADTLANLHLDGSRMALSILGFNLGIELMQLFIILLVAPWLIILSSSRAYTPLRVAGAAFAAVASVAWIIERLTLKPNAVTGFVGAVATHGKWIVLGLASCALLSYIFTKRNACAKSV